MYQSLIARAHVPMASDVAAHFGVTHDEAIEAIRGAGIGKALLPDPDTGEIWMAGPFSALLCSARARRAVVQLRRES